MAKRTYRRKKFISRKQKGGSGNSGSTRRRLGRSRGRGTKGLGNALRIVGPNNTGVANTGVPMSVTNTYAVPLPSNSRPQLQPPPLPPRYYTLPAHNDEEPEEPLPPIPKK
jgi:hypothetical protein